MSKAKEGGKKKLKKLKKVIEKKGKIIISVQIKKIIKTNH